MNSRTLQWLHTPVHLLMKMKWLMHLICMFPMIVQSMSQMCSKESDVHFLQIVCQKRACPAQRKPEPQFWRPENSRKYITQCFSFCCLWLCQKNQLLKKKVPGNQVA